MPRISFPLFATIALALAFWFFFRVNMPDDPLSSAETAVLVLVAYLLVLSRRRLRRGARKLASLAAASLAVIREAGRRVWNRMAIRSDDPAS